MNRRCKATTSVLSGGHILDAPITFYRFLGSNLAYYNRFYGGCSRVRDFVVHWHVLMRTDAGNPHLIWSEP
ncbi:MAG: hypothetical protein JWR19_4345 [Pedosphaera sp.]|nr:hypothetical protein [Pedosphaera sp.]